MSDAKTYQLGCFFNKDGKIIIDTNHLPSGLELKDEFGSAFRVVREGDKQITHKKPIEPITYGPRFI